MGLPDCGLYRTTRALDGKEAAIPAGLLVYFHNHSRQGPPLVMRPESNTANVWRFAEQGYLVDTPQADAFIAGLEVLPREGHYVVTRALAVTDRQLRPGTLIQVGYNRSGHPILFPARMDGLTITFPTSGYRFERLEVFRQLVPARFGAAASQAWPPKGAIWSQGESVPRADGVVDPPDDDGGGPLLH